MKHLLNLSLLLVTFIGTIGFAQTTPPEPFPLTNWVSANSNDNVVIHNGTGAPITISITVTNNTTNDAPGINIKNCGATTHIAAGSTGICATQDAENPVTFTSDSGTDTAVGTYQIRKS